MNVPVAMLVILAVQFGSQQRGILPRQINVRGRTTDGMYGHIEAPCLV
jgi:hypothetical protein